MPKRSLPCYPVAKRSFVSSTMVDYAGIVGVVAALIKFVAELVGKDTAEVMADLQQSPTLNMPGKTKDALATIKASMPDAE